VNVRHRILRVRVHATAFESVAALAELAGVTPEDLVSVWIAERVWSSGISRGEDVAASRVSADVEPARSPRPPAAQNSRDGRRSLHEEIVAVLESSGGPMSVAEIASAIRKRGQYTAPRTGRPVSTQLVSTRVANPQYRKLFSRSGRLLSLASDRAAKAPGTR
jgi:hypothetical protein